MQFVVEEEGLVPRGVETVQHHTRVVKMGNTHPKSGRSSKEMYPPLQAPTLQLATLRIPANGRRTLTIGNVLGLERIEASATALLLVLLWLLRSASKWA